MKKSFLRLSKMQRRVRARRKTWTNAERFEKRQKNALRLASLYGQNPLIKKLIAEAEQELVEETAHHHEHGEHCDHNHSEEEEEEPFVRGMGALPPEMHPDFNKSENE